MSSKLLTYVAYIITVHVLLTYSGKRQTSCDDAYGCQGTDMTKLGVIQCGGYGGCDSAAIISRGVAGAIECTGSHGCNEAKKLICKKSILCQGYRGCYSSGTITGKLIQCSGSQSCSNCDLATSETTILCGGWESCKKCPLVAITVECDGLSACTSNSITSSKEIICSGNKACIGSKLTSSDSIECSGSVSCKRAKITAKKATFSGSQSGDTAKILGVESIEGGGFNSLSFAEMDSENTTSMTIKLAETSGKESTILARSDSTVTLECTEACSDTELLAFSGANITVTVTTTEEDTSGSGGSGSEGTQETVTIDCTENPHDSHCPMIQTSESDCEDVILFKYLENKRKIQWDKLYNIDNEYDNDNNIVWNDLFHEIYDIKNDIISCDSSIQCDGTIILNKEAKCYAASSCHAAHINCTEQNQIFDTQCYGNLACKEAVLNNKFGSIECDGTYSCQMSKYIRAKYLTCRGYGSCENSEYISTNSLNCEASYSCAYNQKIENKLNIKCLANKACYQSHITSGNVLCDGSYSCSESPLIDSSGTVKCTGAFSCSKSIIYADNYVYADGDNAASLSMIYTPLIRGYGYKSLSQSIMDSNHLGKLTLKLYGNLTGYGATIICRHNDECILKCDATGCKNLLYVCLDGSDCKIFPTACANDITRNNTKRDKGFVSKVINGINCPQITTEIPPDVLLFIRNKKKYNKNNMLYSYSNIVSDNYNNKIKENNNNNIKLRVYGFCICVISIILIISFYYYKLQYKNGKDYYESII